MSFLTKLFGGGESSSKPVQIPTQTPEQQALQLQLTRGVSTGLQGPQPTAPNMYIPTTSQEQSYLNWVNQLSNQKAIQDLMSGQPGYQVGPEAANQLYEQSIRPSYMREYQDVALPTLRAAYSGPGYWGGARAGAEAKAGSDLAYNLAKAKSELMYGEEQARRRSIDEAYGRVMPTAESLGKTYGEAGAMTRQIEQEKVADRLQRFLMGEEVDGQYSMAYNPNVSLALSILGIKPYAIGQAEESEKETGLITGTIGAISGLKKIFG